MLDVTERARQELNRILSENADSPESGLRLTISGEQQLRLAIDTEMPGDQIVEHEGSKVLLVETELAISLKEFTLDIEDTPEGPALTMLKHS